MFFGGKSQRKTETGGFIGPRFAGIEKRPQARVSFSRAQKIFPDVPPKTLCTLVELPSFSPSDVFAVVPQASSEQLAKFFDIVEESRSSQHMHSPIVEDMKEEKVPKGDSKKSEAVESTAVETDYFAHDDALEPAFAVVNQVLRQNENIGAVLKDSHTTFLGLAQSFQTKSHVDRDCEGNEKQKTTRSMYRRQSSGREVARRRKRTKPYQQGFCHDFEKKSLCSKRNCALLHECALCGSKRHGKAACSRY